MRRLLLSAALLLATAAFEGAAETYEYDDIDGNAEPDDAAASNANSSEMPPYPETIGDFVFASDVGKGPAGECAVGPSCGAAAGWTVRRVQGARRHRHRRHRHRRDAPPRGDADKPPPPTRCPRAAAAACQRAAAARRRAALSAPPRPPQALAVVGSSATQ